MNTIPISPEASPCSDLQVKCLGKVKRIVINGGGGMGGSQLIVYGKVVHAKEGTLESDMGQVKITLPVSKRVIFQNPRYIGNCEEVKLWCATTTTGNGNFAQHGERSGQNRILSVYFTTPVDVTCTASQPHNHDRKPDQQRLCNVLTQTDMGKANAYAEPRCC